MYNKNVHNRSFDETTIQKVWEKGVVVYGYDSNVIRKDSCGAFIQRDKHGDTSHKYGWEVDHIKPVSKGGIDDLNNLQPLHWKNNRHKADNYPGWSCIIKAA